MPVTKKNAITGFGSRSPKLGGIVRHALQPNLLGNNRSANQRSEVSAKLWSWISVAEGVLSYDDPPDSPLARGADVVLITPSIEARV